MLLNYMINYREIKRVKAALYYEESSKTIFLIPTDIGHGFMPEIALKDIMQFDGDIVFRIQPAKCAKWGNQVLKDDGFGGKQVGYICPVCKQFVPNKGNFCLNCGAGMRSNNDEKE